MPVDITRINLGPHAEALVADYLWCRSYGSGSCRAAPRALAALRSIYFVDLQESTANPIHEG